ncbi:MAG: hypothetical protein ED559_11665 [Phycisphaera sp.]|nr:MAG: hypothetical protein ED559_11665 [Phycisphaera sp.]
MVRDRFANSVWITVCTLLGVAGYAAAQDSPETPRSDRVIALFDFEEPDNPFDFPGSFFRAQSDPNAGIERPGYPVFNIAEFDFEQSYSGSASVRLPVRRGSVSLRLRPGVLPIFPDADYRLSCKVRAEGLVHSRFRLVARFLDTSGEPIAGSELSSDPIMPGAGWEAVEVVIPGGEAPGAAFLQIDTEVIQPELFAEPTLGKHQVWEEDYSGAAWVDDVLVEQLPRLSLRTQSDTNIVAAPDIPEFRLLVRDLTGHNLEAHLVVRDHFGRVVDRQTREVQSSQIPSVWRPSISRFGWYTADVHLLSTGYEISVVPLVFCWVPEVPEEAAVDSTISISKGRYGLGAETFEDALIPIIDELAERLSADTFTLGAWESTTSPDASSALALRMGELSNTSTSSWNTLGISLPEVPEELSRIMQADPDEVLRVLAVNDNDTIDTVDSMIEPLLDRLGQFVRRWRIGPLTSTKPFWDPTTPEQASRARALLSLLVPGPIVDLPWSPLHDFSALSEMDAVAAVTVHLPQGSGIHVVKDVLTRWKDSGISGTKSLTLSLGTGRSGQFGPGQASSELVKRMVLIEDTITELGLTKLPDVELDKPWQWSDGLDPQFMPTPEAAAWRATIDRLRGRRVAANLTFEPGTHVYLLTPIDPESGRGGALVAWNDTASFDEASVEIFLGEDDVTAIDMWGNTSGTISPKRLDAGNGAGIDIHEIPITTDPVFIEGIDVELALFTSSIRLDNPVLQATPGPHERTISLRNPWTVAIDGSLIISEPSPRLPSGMQSGWEISPRVIRFSAAPGETIEIPISIAFPAVEPAGQKQLVIDVLLSAGPTAERIRSASKFDVELEGIELDVRAIVASNGTDVAVEAVVTNTTLEPVDLDLSAAARGYPRQGAPIAQLAPGASVVRRFMYPGGMDRLKGGEIYVSVEDPLRLGRLNKSVAID